MRVNIPTGAGPLYYLWLLITDDLIKEILKGANAFAQHVIM